MSFSWYCLSLLKVYVMLLFELFLLLLLLLLLLLFYCSIIQHVRYYVELFEVFHFYKFLPFGPFSPQACTWTSPSSPWWAASRSARPTSSRSTCRGSWRPWGPTSASGKCGVWRTIRGKSIFFLCLQLAKRLLQDPDQRGRPHFLQVSTKKEGCFLFILQKYISSCSPAELQFYTALASLVIQVRQTYSNFPQ